MAIPATILYFGQHPTTILMQTSTNFDGVAAQAVDPVLSPGLYTFAEQAAGGVYNFHTDPIEVKNVTFACADASATCTIYKVIGGVRSKIAVLSASANEYSQNTTLVPGEHLEMVSTGSGAKKLAITAALASCFWAT